MGLCPHIHFTPPHPFIPVQIIMSQDNSNYSTTDIISMGSKLFPSVKYTFHLIYSHTSPSTKHNLWNNLFKHTLGGFMSTYPFYSSTAISPLSKKLYCNTIQTIQLHILFQWDQNYFLQSNILFTQYILTPVHPLNTSYIIIYLNTLWVSLCPHTHFTPPWPFLPCPKYYVTTWFKLFNYTYYLNGIKIISFSQIYFSLYIF